RNRIDEVVLFSPLSRDEVREIARHYLSKIEDTLRARKKTMTIDPDVIEALVEEGHSLSYGARFLRRVIDERIRLPLSQHWGEAHFHFKTESGKVVLQTSGPHLALAYGT